MGALTPEVYTRGASHQRANTALCRARAVEGSGTGKKRGQERNGVRTLFAEPKKKRGQDSFRGAHQRLARMKRNHAGAQSGGGVAKLDRRAVGPHRWADEHDAGRDLRRAEGGRRLRGEGARRGHQPHRPRPVVGRGRSAISAGRRAAGHDRPAAPTCRAAAGQSRAPAGPRGTGARNPDPGGSPHSRRNSLRSMRRSSRLPRTSP